MAFGLSWLWKCVTPAPHTAPAAEKARVRPTLETLEDRTVPTTIPLQFTGVIPEGGGNFLAVAQVGVNPVMVPVSLTPDPANSQILDLHLNPIHLNLLGLHLDTSSICLDITTTGSGLLGQLLGQIAGSGNGNGNGHGNLGGVLGQLEGPLLNLILNLEANTITSGATTNPSPTQQPNTTNILNLELGPLNLNLLGLNVALNNCASPPGPITVDLTAQSGNGLLLGNLLTDLANALNPSQQQLLGNVATEILNVV